MATVSHRVPKKQSAGPETGELWIAGIVLMLSFIAAIITLIFPTGAWPRILQFSLGGWPNDAEHYLDMVGYGAFLQVLFGFGFPRR